MGDGAELEADSVAWEKGRDGKPTGLRRRSGLRSGLRGKPRRKRRDAR